MKRIKIESWQTYGDYFLFSDIVDFVKNKTGHSTIVQIDSYTIIFMCNRSYAYIIKALKEKGIKFKIEE
jgi:hypothetical protein